MKKLIQLVLNLIIFQNLSIASRSYSPRAYRMPNLCKNESYCTHMGEYYPNDTVADALKTFLNSRWADVIQPNNTMICDSIEDQSQLTECDSTYICDARVYYVTDVHNNTRVVIQSDLQGVQYKQIYLISKCTQEGRISGTRNFLEQHLKGLNVTCSTKYSDYPFLVLNDKHASAEVIRAYLPVFCQCTMKSNWV